MDDLVKRLREVDPMDYPGPACEAMEEAAAALEAKDAELARLREALIAIDALDPESRIGDCSVNAISGLVLRMGEIARAALQAKE